MRRHPNVVHEDELTWSEFTRGTRYAERRKQLGLAAGSERLGCSVYELPPGRTAWPKHYHLGNEEAIYVLEGVGTLTIGDRTLAVRTGDWVALPVGAKYTHQLVNTSASTLRYLCMSTMVEPDITVYPDSGKIGVYAGSAPGGPRESRTFGGFIDNGARRDFWDGEPE
jgi:uncharacterized cupin superfamily protein